jgi:hypothetical protein
MALRKIKGGSKYKKFFMRHFWEIYRFLPISKTRHCGTERLILLTVVRMADKKFFP